MRTFCPECIQKLVERGFASEIYFLICDYYLRDEEPIVLYEPVFAEALRYLETNGFIITTEAFDDVIYAIPRTYALEDRETDICCSGFCQRVIVDFKSD